jgi:uncharacterized protein involved in exopolysaccharide biosynthesis
VFYLPAGQDEKGQRRPGPADRDHQTKGAKRVIAMPEVAPDSIKPPRDASGRGVKRVSTEVRNWLRVLRRWLWVIIVVVVVTVAVLALWLATASPEYAAAARIGLPTLSERAVTAFTEVLKSRSVRVQTVAQLGLEGHATVYGVDVRNLGNAGFLELTIVSDDANLAAQIANAHTDLAIAHFGALRAQPAEEDLRVLTGQLAEAQEELYAAEQALAEFQTEHAIGSLKERLIQYERILGALTTDRDRRMFMGLSTAGIEEAITYRRQELSSLAALGPGYNALEDAVAQAQKVFNQVHNKHIAAELALTAAQATDDIQLVDPARAPAQPATVPSRLFAVGLAGAFVLGIVLAFTLESIFPSRVSEREQKS